MKVFLGWSGPKSLRVATILRHWLPEVLPNVKPWVSEEDIAKGTRWSPELWRCLRTADFGIVCLVPGMLSQPWVLFEAGVLAGGKAKDKVAPFLVGVCVEDLPSPLTEFQCVKRRRNDVLRLVKRINELAGSATTLERTLTRAFDKTWPKVQRRLLDAERAEFPPEEDIPDELTGGGEPDRDLDPVSIEILEHLYKSTLTRENAFGMSLTIPKPVRLIKLRLIDLFRRGFVSATSPNVNIAYFMISHAGLRYLDDEGLT